MIIVKYKKNTWIELPWYRFYLIVKAIKNLLGNTGYGKVKYIIIYI